MKKIFAVLFAAMMLIVSGAALAEEEVTELNWADVEAKIAESGIEGEMVTYEDIGVQIFMPSVFVQAELTEEDEADGMVDCYMTEDESAIVGLYYTDAEGMELAEYAGMMEEDGFTVEAGVINGLAAAVCESAEEDMVVIAFATEAGAIVEFAFAPISDEEFSAIAMIMTASIQPAA